MKYKHQQEECGQRNSAVQPINEVDDLALFLEPFQFFSLGIYICDKRVAFGLFIGDKCACGVGREWESSWEVSELFSQFALGGCGGDDV